MPFAKNVIGKMQLPSSLGTGQSIQMPKFNEPIQAPGERYQQVPSGTEFEEPGLPRQIEAPADTRYANLGKIPGQFFQSPSTTTGIVRQEEEQARGTVAAKRDIYTAGLPGTVTNVDHIMPIWLGGSSTPENLRVLVPGKHKVVTAAQAAVLSLFRNPELSKKYIGRELDLPEARMWAIRAIDFTPTQVKSLKMKGDSGLLSAKNREEEVKMAANAFNSWNARPSKLGWSAVRDYLRGGETTGWQALKSILPIPTSWKEAGIALRAGPGAIVSTEESKMAGETLGRGIARHMPDTALSRFIQGATTGGTLGHIPIPGKETDTGALKAAHFGGALFGGLAPLFTGGEIYKAAPRVIGKFSPKLAKTLFPSIDVALAEASKNLPASAKFLRNSFTNKRFAAFLKRLPANATIFGALGQLSRQEENTIEARAKELAADIGVAGVVSLVKPGLSPELWGVWAGTTVIDALAGASPTEAATNGTIMTLFHAMGGAGAEEPFYRSSVEAANRFTQARFLPGERPYAPEKMPTTQQEVDVVKMGYEAELQKIRSRVESDPNLTPEQKESEIMKIILAQRVKYLSTLPAAERNKLAKEDYKSLLNYFAEKPSKGKGISQEAESAKKVADNLEDERWTNFEDEKGTEFESGGVVGELPQAVVDRITRATEDGVLIRTEDGRLVPDANVKTMVVLRDDVPTKDGGPTGEIVMIPPDGPPISLGLAGPEAKTVIDRLTKEGSRMTEAVIPEIIPGEHTKIKVKVTETLLKRSEAVNLIDKEINKQEVSEIKTAVKKRPALMGPEQVPAKLIRKEGKFEFSKAPKTAVERPLTNKEIERSKSMYPAETVAEVLKRDTAKGTLRKDMLPALNDKQIQRAMRETVIAARKPLLEAELASNLESQLKNLFSEYERRLEKTMIQDPNLDINSEEFKQASITIDKEQEKMARQLMELGLTPSSEIGIVDPAITERTLKLQKELGLPPDEALHEAVKQDVAIRMLGVKPKAKLSRGVIPPVPMAKPVPRGSVKTVAPIGKRFAIGRQVEASELAMAEAIASTGKKTLPEEWEDIRRKVEQIEATPERGKGDIWSKPKETNPDRERQFYKTQTALVSELEGVPRLKKETFAGRPREDFEKRSMISGYESDLKEALDSYLTSVERSIDLKKNRLLLGERGQEAEQIRTAKISPRKLQGYKGLEKDDIYMLRQQGEAWIDLKLEQAKEVETQYAKGEGETLWERAPSDMTSNEEYNAYQEFAKGVEEGRFSGEEGEYYAIRDLYVENDLATVQRNSVLRYDPKLNPEAKRMDDAWNKLVEEKKIIDTDDQSFRRDFARVWIDGDTRVKNESVLDIPELTTRLKEIEFEKNKEEIFKTTEKKFDFIKESKKKALENITYQDKDVAGKTIEKPIMNPIARLFEVEARKAEASKNEDSARFSRELNEKMAKKYTPWTTKEGEAIPGWYEVVLRDPTKLFAADASMGSHIVMTPTEAEVIQRFYSGTLFKNNTSDNPMVHEVVRRLEGQKGQIYTSLVPNEVQPERSVNIRNVVRGVVAEKTGIGDFLNEIAKTPEERNAVKNFLETGNESYLIRYQENKPADTKLFDALIDFEMMSAQAPTTNITSAAMQRYGEEIAARWGMKPEFMEDIFARYRGTRAGEVIEREVMREKGEEISGEGEEEVGVYGMEELKNQDYTLFDLVTGALARAKPGGEIGDIESKIVSQDFQTLSEGERKKATDLMSEYLSNLLVPAVKEARGAEWFIEEKGVRVEKQKQEDIKAMAERLSELMKKKRKSEPGKSYEKTRLDEQITSVRQDLARLEGRFAPGEPFKTRKEFIKEKDRKRSIVEALKERPR